MFHLVPIDVVSCTFTRESGAVQFEVHVRRALDNKILLTGEVLRQKWEAFAKLAGVPEEDKLKLS